MASSPPPTPTPERGMRHAAVRGLLWTAWGKGAQAVLQLAVVAILARLVSPADFGS